MELETVCAITAGDERVRVRRDEIALMAAIRANLLKYTTGRARSRSEVERDIRQLLSRAVMSDGILDVFQSAGLNRPELSILSDELDLPRFSGEPLAYLAACLSNAAGLTKSSAEWRRTGL